MQIFLLNALWRNFLGNSNNWFKFIIIFFLIVNPLIFLNNSFFAGWLLLSEFIFILSMALKCYPLIPGGLLILEAIIIGMTNSENIIKEIKSNIEVFLLLIFMVSSIHFMKQLLLFLFNRLLVNIKNKNILSLSFCFFTTFLSAFLDALTVVAILITIITGLYNIYHQIIIDYTNKKKQKINYINLNNEKILEKFRGFLRNVIMHSSIGSAMGGVMTMVGEPQNLIIAKAVNWKFIEFFLHIAPISIPVFISGLITCWALEKFNLFGYGTKLPEEIFKILKDFDKKITCQYNTYDKLKLVTQGIIGIILIIALAFQVAEVGLIGLSIIILSTTFNGITDEHAIGKAFINSLPFTALLVVFFSIVSIISDQQLFKPIIDCILQTSDNLQVSLFYIFSGLLSSISDNVFVGTIYINEAKHALERDIINIQQFELLAIAINIGTNLPSIATPNGQAAFLFLLTSSLAPLIRLSYIRMIYMALPYTIILTTIGFICIKLITIPIT